MTFQIILSSPNINGNDSLFTFTYDGCYINDQSRIYIKFSNIKTQISHVIYFVFEPTNFEKLIPQLLSLPLENETLATENSNYDIPFLNLERNQLVVEINEKPVDYQVLIITKASISKTQKVRIIFHHVGTLIHHEEKRKDIASYSTPEYFKNPAPDVEAVVEGLKNTDLEIQKKALIMGKKIQLPVYDVIEKQGSNLQAMKIDPIIAAQNYELVFNRDKAIAYLLGYDTELDTKEFAFYWRAKHFQETPMHIEFNKNDFITFRNDCITILKKIERKPMTDFLQETY